MDSTDSGMVQIEIDGLIITVDRETARMLQADPEACKNYSRQIRQQLFGKEQQTLILTYLYLFGKQAKTRLTEIGRPQDFFLT
ncbi:hypothetical protein JTB14_005601 [Gonioctena quinquepunctata]|nr:hypothetical protein JTB14_005601 [Gonioctena quinquepunctata]